MAMTFFPGIAQDELNNISVREGKPKAVILRELIERAAVSDSKVMRDGYSFLTQIGKEMQAAYYQKAEMSNQRLSDLADKALKTANKLTANFVYEPLENRDLSLLKCALGTSMKFRPMEQDGKLERLAKQSGLSKRAVLRALVLGIRLPNMQSMKTLGRMAQIAGLIKYLSSELNDWDIFAKGCQLHRIAGSAMRSECKRRQNTEGILESTTPA